MTLYRVQMQVRTTDFGVGLDKHLTSFLPQQHRLPETREVVAVAVADGGVAVVQSSASFHVCCRLQDLQHGYTHE